MEDFEQLEEKQNTQNMEETTESVSEFMQESEVLPSQDIPEEAQDPLDYKEEMRRLKQAYKAQRKEEKRKLQEEESACYRPRTFRTVLISVLSTVLILAILLGFMAYFPSQKQSVLAHIVRKYVAAVQNPYPTQDDVTLGGQAVKPGDDVTIQVDGNYSASAVYAKAGKSVVGIEVRQLSSNKPWVQDAEEVVVSQGSGVIYSEDGMIITNHHVVEMAINQSTRSFDNNYKVVVYFSTDLTAYYTAGALLGYDADNDIALIKVEAKGLTPAEFADADALEVGEPVVAIGSPGGLEFMNSLSEGIISGLDRDITSSSNNVTVYELIQTTAAINPGNSGGALLNREGKLIGICVIKIVSESYEGMGFAINANTVTRIVDSFLQYGRYVKPVLGVEVNTLYDAQEADSKGLPIGAYVQKVTAGGAAARAGIRPNDIICEIGGERIVKFSQLRKYLLRYGPEDTISVKVYRTSTQEYMDITVKLHASE